MTGKPSLLQPSLISLNFSSFKVIYGLGHMQARVPLGKQCIPAVEDVLEKIEQVQSEMT